MFQYPPVFDITFFGFRVACRVFVMRGGGVIFIELLGALWAFEFMALAGNGKQGNGHKQDRK